MLEKISLEKPEPVEMTSEPMSNKVWGSAAESRRPTQYRQYSPTAVTNAMEKIRAKEVSIYKAFKIYNIPETTLLAERVDIETVRSGPSTLLTLKEEAKLVQHLKYIATLGYGYTRSELLDIASDYTYECGKRSKDKPLSRQWYSSFLTR
ncbi:LOW QUALITY PROTEIN: hypothetical protein KUTeg_018743 [Tegillarca granosa]|uniref:HTH psq-type domain-containing protein n=1 Tax=Tegillarca granosa TaxID=220873 RepID=A0ABQ9EED8_TEGGR|nr:LOW QUALITY PROTEIN: hypothetical protein KUTeg_018743 [Tegillarca granosa]